MVEFYKEQKIDNPERFAQINKWLADNVGDVTTVVRSAEVLSMACIGIGLAMLFRANKDSALSPEWYAEKAHLLDEQIYTIARPYGKVHYFADTPQRVKLREEIEKKKRDLFGYDGME